MTEKVPSSEVSEPRAVATGPNLTDRAWAVIGTHYVKMELTYSEAMADAKDLVSRKQHAVVVTNEAAQRMIQNNAGLQVASMPDMKF
jgi:hypothetical protein